MERREIAVVGGGLAGTATAIALARSGFDTILFAPPAPTDFRSTALIGASMDFLDRIDLAASIRRKGESLAVMRLVDDTGRLFRAPTIEFRASEIDRPAFGTNILNADLAALLDDAVNETDRLERRAIAATGIETDRDGAVLTLADGSRIAVCLVVAADGRRSAMREAAGIRTRDWRYPQTALVFNIGHDVPHDQISTEFHTKTGPFTQVPLPGRRSAIVWVERPDLAELYVDVKTEKLEHVVEEKMHSILGRVTIESEIQAFPLSGASVDRLTGERLALVGRSARRGSISACETARRWSTASSKAATIRDAPRLFSASKPSDAPMWQAARSVSISSTVRFWPTCCPCSLPAVSACRPWRRSRLCGVLPCVRALHPAPAFSARPGARPRTTAQPNGLTGRCPVERRYKSRVTVATDRTVVTRTVAVARSTHT